MNYDGVRTQFNNFSYGNINCNLIAKYVITNEQTYKKAI